MAPRLCSVFSPGGSGHAGSPGMAGITSSTINTVDSSPPCGVLTFPGAGPGGDPPDHRDRPLPCCPTASHRPGPADRMSLSPYWADSPFSPSSSAPPRGPPDLPCPAMAPRHRRRGGETGQGRPLSDTRRAASTTRSLFSALARSVSAGDAFLRPTSHHGDALSPCGGGRPSRCPAASAVPPGPCCRTPPR